MATPSSTRSETASGKPSVGLVSERVMHYESLLDLEAQTYGALSHPKETDEEKMKGFITKDEKKDGGNSPTMELLEDPHTLEKGEEPVTMELLEDPHTLEKGEEPVIKKLISQHEITEEEEEQDRGKEESSQKKEGESSQTKEEGSTLHHLTQTPDKQLKETIEKTMQQEITKEQEEEKDRGKEESSQKKEGESSESEEEKKSEFEEKKPEEKMFGKIKKQYEKMMKRLIKAPDGDGRNGGSGIGEESNDDQILDRLERSFNEAETKLQHLKTSNISIMSYSAAANAAIIAIAIANFKLFITKEEEIRILKEYVSHLFHLVDFAMHTLLTINIVAYVVTIIQKVEKMNEFKKTCKVDPCPLFRGSGYRDWGNHWIWIICSFLLQVWVWVMFYAIGRGMRNLCFNLFHSATPNLFSRA